MSKYERRWCKVLFNGNQEVYGYIGFPFKELNSADLCVTDCHDKNKFGAYRKNEVTNLFIAAGRVDAVYLLDDEECQEDD